MSISDDVNRLRDIASSDRIPTAAIRAIQISMLDTNAVVADILGPGHGFYQGIGATSAEISRHLDAALAACQEYESAIHDAADRLEQAGG